MTISYIPVCLMLQDRYHAIKRPANKIIVRLLNFLLNSQTCPSQLSLSFHFPYLLMLFLLMSSVLGECEFKKSKGPNSFVAALARPSRTFAKLLPINVGTVTTDVPTNWTSMDQNMGYLMSVVGFGVSFLGIFIFFIFWFCIWQCCACCCSAKEAKKPSVLLVIFHIIASLFMILAAILFFVAAASVTSGLNELGKAPDQLVESLSFVSDTVNSTMFTAIDAVYPTISSVDVTLTSLANWLGRTVDEKKTTAAGIAPKVDTYKTDVSDQCVSALQPDTQKQVNTVFTETTQKVKDVAQKMVDGADDVKNTVDKARQTINDNLKNAVKEVDSIRADLNDMLTPIVEIKTSSETATDLMTKYIDLAKKYASPVSICAALFILLIALTYCILFFFPCCCTRCLFAWFPSCGLLLSLLCLVPAAVFGIVFVFLNDNCSNLERAALGFTGSFIPNVTTDDFVEMLLCPTEQPLYDMGLRSVFDYEAQILDPLLDQLHEKMNGAFDIENLGLDGFKDFSEGLEWDTYMTGKNMVGYEQVKYDESDNKGEFKTCVDGKENSLSAVRSDMDSVASFGDQVYPRVNSASDDIQTLVNVLMNNTRTTIADGVNRITCMTLRCVYSPVKNSICVHLQDGAAWWVLSSLCLIIGLLGMTFVVCFRRPGLGKPSVESGSCSDSDLSDWSSSS